MATTAQSLATTGEISRRLSRPVHAVEYVIRARGIKPSGRAGHMRIFDEASVSLIETELKRIEDEREGAR